MINVRLLAEILKDMLQHWFSGY